MGAVIATLAVVLAAYAIAHAVPFGGGTAETGAAPEADGLPATSSSAAGAAVGSNNSVKAGSAPLASGLPASSQSGSMPCSMENGKSG